MKATLFTETDPGINIFGDGIALFTLRVSHKKLLDACVGMVGREDYPLAVHVQNPKEPTGRHKDDLSQASLDSLRCRALPGTI